MPVTKKIEHKLESGEIIELDIGAMAKNVEEDQEHRFTTDKEKLEWNSQIARSKKAGETVNCNNAEIGYDGSTVVTAHLTCQYVTDAICNIHIVYKLNEVIMSDNFSYAFLDLGKITQALGLQQLSLNGTDAPRQASMILTPIPVYGYEYKSENDITLKIIGISDINYAGSNLYTIRQGEGAKLNEIAFHTIKDNGDTEHWSPQIDSTLFPVGSKGRIDIYGATYQ